MKKTFDQNNLIEKLYKRINELACKKRNMNGVIETLSEKIDKLEKENKKLRKIKVLQVYPKLEAAYQLKNWMEKWNDGYGKGMIQIECVILDIFNKNPYAWLK